MSASVGDKEVDESFAEFAKRLPSREPVTFTERETRILEIYDQLMELRLEGALLDAQSNLGREQDLDIPEHEASLKLDDAKREVLEARAAYLLRNSIVENVIQADPLMKAVHAGQNAKPMERALHPLVDERDLLSIAQTNLSTRLQLTTNALTLAQTENIKAAKENRELAATLWSLTDQLKKRDIESINDPEVKQQLEGLQAETKESKQQYRVMKGLVGGVVAASGVDWAADDELRDIVLDAED